MGIGITSIRSTHIHETVNKPVERAQRATFRKDHFDVFNLCTVLSDLYIRSYVDILFQFIWCEVLTRPLIYLVWKEYVYKGKLRKL